MKITKVTYGRSIEVGGPFGRRPVEKVWFGWEAEVEPSRDTEESVLGTLQDKADQQEQIEKELYYKRKNEFREGVELARKAKGSYVIRKNNVSSSHEEYLQHSPRETIAWGPYESAYVASSQDDAIAYTERRGLTDKDYGLFPGPRRLHTSLSHKHEEQDPAKDREGT